mmetsp:Transcript_9287/g.20531  ORF Transcript_9287/g.20531 Transcript_9287/m.20531 type:complete len:421 (-) Transcript_9287:4-1266(-)
MYEIYKDATTTPREKAGCIQIRIRIEWLKPQRNVLLAALKPPHQNYINVKKLKILKTSKFTCQGKHGTKKESSVEFLFAWLEELMDYGIGYYFIEDSIKALFLWRSHSIQIPYPKFGRSFKLAFYTIYLPLYSFMAYLICILLVEKPFLFPSFFFGCLALLLQIVQGHRMGHPSPWKKCSSTLHFLFILLFNWSPFQPESISPNKGTEHALLYDATWETRLHVARKTAEIRSQIFLEEQKKLLEELGHIGDENIESKFKPGVVDTKIDLLGPYVEPYRPFLNSIRKWLRFISNIIIWEDSYKSFWVTMGFFLLSFINFLIPWRWFILWTSRVVVWVGMGPWMRYVDIKYVEPYELHEDDLDDFTEKEKKKVVLANNSVTDTARLTRENVVKLRDMKKLHFGKSNVMLALHLFVVAILPYQ